MCAEASFPLLISAPLMCVNHPTLGLPVRKNHACRYAPAKYLTAQVCGLLFSSVLAFAWRVQLLQLSDYRTLAGFSGGVVCHVCQKRPNVGVRDPQVNLCQASLTQPIRQLETATGPKLKAC